MADINGDGYVDLLSGSYTGELHCWYGDKNREFGSNTILNDAKGEVIIIGDATAVTTVDIDGDGDLDLVVNGEYDGAFLIKNIGDRKNPLFDTVRTVVKYGDTHVNGSVVEFFDWDGDGILDLLFTNDDSNVCFCKGNGKTFGEPEILIESSHEDKNLNSGDTPTVSGSGARFSIYDYNKDGKMDIVMGATSYISHKRALTEEQIEFKKSARAELKELLAQWSELQEEAIKKHKIERYTLSRAPYDKISKKLGDKIRPIDKRCSELYNILEKYETEYRKATSFVWVYYRK